MLSIPVCKIYTIMVLELLHPLYYFTNGCCFVYHLGLIICSYFVSIAFAVGVVNSYTCSFAC